MFQLCTMSLTLTTDERREDNEGSVEEKCFYLHKRFVKIDKSEFHRIQNN